MHISRIELNNFRNHQHLILDDLQKVIIIVGDNAVGKTNIIEALQLLAMHESFRHPKIQEMIYKGGECHQASLSVTFTTHETPNTKQLILRNEGKSFLLNNKERQPREVLDSIPSVLFTPDDLLIIKGPPEQRRDMLDSLGTRLSKTFGQIKQDYYKALKQKNSLLKQDEVDVTVLDSWNKHLAVLGASLSKHRQGLCEQLLSKASLLYNQISGGEDLVGTYRVSWKEIPTTYNDEDIENNEITSSISNEEIDEAELYNAYSKRAEIEIAAKRCLIGPHKDDISFEINHDDARRFASQGQQRSIALALKIAEIEILKRVSGRNPLLLLDDVMSELDATRRGYFTELVNDAGQTVITTTNLSYFNETFLNKATVVTLRGNNDEE